MTHNPSLSQQETDEINPYTSQLNFRGVSLRNRLLYLILPTILGSLTLSGYLGYRFLIRDKAQAELKQQLIDGIELGSKTIEQKLIEAKKTTQLLATSSETLDSISNAEKIVNKSNLNDLSIDELEQKFTKTKLLQPNQKLNQNLQRIAKISGLEEIFYTDRNGFNIAYSNPTSDFVQQDETWWQKGKSKDQWLSNPEFDESANTVGFELVQAIKDPQTDKFLGVIKTLLPETYFDEIANNLSHLGITDSQIIQIISPEEKLAVKTITSAGLIPRKTIIGEADIAQISTVALQNRNDISNLKSIIKNKYNIKDFNSKIYDEENNIAVTKFSYGDRYYTLLPVLNEDLVVIASIDKSELQTAGSDLIPVIIGAVLAVMVSSSIIIILVANRLADPLVDLATVAEQAAVGNLNVVAQGKGTLETQTLANSLNNLIYQVNNLLNQQGQEANLAKGTKNIIFKINESQDFQSIIDTVVQEIQSVLSTERVVYYQFDEKWQGETLAESLDYKYQSTMDSMIYNPDYIQDYINEYAQNQVQVINDIKQVYFSEEQLEKLENFQVKSSLAVAIFVQEKPTALLVIHQCSSNRSWQPQEIAFLEQVANQLSFSLDRLEFLEQQKKSRIQAKQAQEKLQWRALELLQEVDPLSQGDLTIRAKVTEDEIGTIADSYNSTIASLYKLVNQVKAVAKEVETTADNSQDIVTKLTQESVEQAASISETVTYIQEIDKSIRSVSEKASQAQKIVRQAAETIDVGDDAMNQTVLKINSIQKTVSVTEEKVKRLGESSQEISQVLGSISSFAAQTHLLALKASIEAARAGEKGKGFAVIADEVRSLATQSATATADIENFLVKIQLETSEVAEAMATGTKQVAEGTKLVEHTRQSLDSVNAASSEIRTLVTEIVESALLQSKTSNLVSNNIANVAINAEENSQSATQVSEEIKQLLTVAGKLRHEINQFKT